MWGGAPGEVNGNKGLGANSCYENTGTAGFYGFGNCNSGDSQGITVYYGPTCTRCGRRGVRRQRRRSRAPQGRGRDLVEPRALAQGLARLRRFGTIRYIYELGKVLYI